MLDSTVVCRRALGCEWGVIINEPWRPTDEVVSAPPPGRGRVLTSTG